jgi:predicted ATPase/class 3 adenylate cyclase
MEPELSAGGEVLPLARPRADVALPAGDVTFVFTDVVGSTRLLASLGERFAPLLAVHQSIVAKAMADHGGVLVNTEGDALFFACPSAIGAVEGALEAQAAMAAHPWPPEHRLTIRAGMHTGPARPIGHGYIALAVHQASRICAAGHGGQVLASATTAALVERQSRHLGRFWLKDFDEPVTLVQYDDGDHPPLKVLPESVRRLVLPDTSFVGREEELAELGALLDVHRLVTVCGPGGAGKTRLAIELASRSPAGRNVSVAELAGARNPAEVISAVAAGLGLSQSPEVSVTDLVTSYLVGVSEPRLILDNCEQVIDAVADLVTELMLAAPHLRLLLTSREPLGVPGERVLRLAPLETPAVGTTLNDLLASDAARLLVDRVMARDSGFQLAPSDAHHVVAICRRLDGSPLALELVAAEVAAAGLAAARESVESGAGLEGGRGRPERHRSLEAALDWSYQLLEPEERLVWQRLAVFVAPFRLEDAVALAADGEVTGPVVRDAVTALVNKSVITRVSAADGDRFRMHQAVREFGQAKLRAAGELATICDRHADWAREFLDRNYYKVTPPGWFAAFEVCRDDLVAAWHHVQSAGQIEKAAEIGSNTAYWDYFTSRSAEGAALLNDIASWPDGPYLVGPLIHAAAVVARSQQIEKARRYLAQAFQYPLAPEVEEAAKDTLVQISLEEGDFEVVQEHARRLLAQPIPAAAPMSHAWALSMLGICALCQGELDDAMSYCRQSREQYVELGQLVNASIMAVNLASVAIMHGDLARAAHLATDALQLAESAAIADQAAVARMLLAAARPTERSRSQVAAALRELANSQMPLELGDFHQSLPVLRSLREWRALAVAAGAFASVYAATRNPFPLLDRLLAEVEGACLDAMPRAEYDELRGLGYAAPAYATILAALAEGG